MTSWCHHSGLWPYMHCVCGSLKTLHHDHLMNALMPFYFYAFVWFVTHPCSRMPFWQTCDQLQFVPQRPSRNWQRNTKCQMTLPMYTCALLHPNFSPWEFLEPRPLHTGPLWWALTAEVSRGRVKVTGKLLVLPYINSKDLEQKSTREAALLIPEPNLSLGLHARLT